MRHLQHAADIFGRLHLIKHYPGLVLSDEPKDIVFGELYRLRDSSCAIGWSKPRISVP